MSRNCRAGMSTTTIASCSGLSGRTYAQFANGVSSLQTTYEERMGRSLAQAKYWEAPIRSLGLGGREYPTRSASDTILDVYVSLLIISQAMWTCDMLDPRLILLCFCLFFCVVKFDGLYIPVAVCGFIRTYGGCSRLYSRWFIFSVVVLSVCFWQNICKW